MGIYLHFGLQGLNLLTFWYYLHFGTVLEFFKKILTFWDVTKKYPRHDIALLETVDELYNAYSSAAPACLPQTARTMSETEQIMDSARGLDCFVAGYGQIAEKGPASSFLKDTRDSNVI